MPDRPTLRQRFDHLAGLWLRTRNSLRSRGLGATLARIRRQLAPPVQGHAPALVFPPADSPIAFTETATPHASIVIPVHGQLAATLQCLRALAAHPPRTPFEVIVVDDASPDASADTLAGIPGLRLLRRARNGGFIAACNEGAAAARGHFIAFLNNDTVPQPGWLEALLGTFESQPDTGLVGAQLVYPDGRLQESGGRVFSDGSAANLGRFGSRNDPRHARLREVDYCSAAAVVLPAALFRSLGGFDARYAPAYYEDTDLAFAVRAAGHAVRVQPAAVVVHDEGTTAGTDLGQGPKAGQVRNRAVFAGKWAEVLAAHPAPGTPDDAAPGNRPRVLVVDAETPRPDRDSASMRLVALMRLLQSEGADVVFVPDDLSHAGAATEALQHAGIEAWYAPFIDDPSRWLTREGGRFTTVVLCRHHVAARWLPRVRRHAPDARVVFDSVDLHYLRERRAAELAGDGAGLRAAEATRRRELAIVAAADATLVVSPTERELLQADAPGARVELLSNLHEVAGGGEPFERRHDVVFVGGFRHPPNTDAVRWFAGEIWPRVRERLPDARFHVIGSDPPADILALDGRDGIRVHGHVADIRPWMDGARIAVAPLRFGAGVKGKVNLSMAHGQPLVASACAAEGMHLRDGEDVLVADDPVAFADAIVRLHSDAELWRRLARNGQENIRRHFSADAFRETVRRVLLADSAR